MNHDHVYDDLSGWCLYCGVRDDGRLIDRYSGHVLRAGPEYTPSMLRAHEKRVAEVQARRDAAVVHVTILEKPSRGQAMRQMPITPARDYQANS